LLQQSKLIPVETLLDVNHHSPYYNEQNQASVFYAESWALVHYLMLSPYARKEQLLSHFLDAWDKSHNQVQAAVQTFGDLKKFGEQIEAYARQTSFYQANLKSSLQEDEKTYTSRVMSSAEALALRGDMYWQTGRPVEARATLEEAVKLDDSSAIAHENLGTFYFHQHEIPQATKELNRAAELNSGSFLTYYYSAVLNLQQARSMPEEWPKAQASLEKAVSLNPEFAPAYMSLSSLYSLHKDTQDKALAAALRGVKLEPGNINFSVHLGYVLLHMNKIDDAKVLSARLLDAARTPAEVHMAQFFQDAVERRGHGSTEVYDDADSYGTAPQIRV